MNKKQIYITFLIATLTFSCIIQETHKTEFSKPVKASTVNIDWEAYSVKSIVPKEKITYNLLKGHWEAYKGMYRYNEFFNTMNFAEPIEIDFSNNTYKRSFCKETKQFELYNNWIFETTKNTADADTGIINLITPQKLIITWKTTNNYIRYEYEKY